MSEEHSFAVKSKTFPVTMILRIDRSADDFPLQFPVVIRNLVAGVATLEVDNPETIMDWESLKGLGGCLRLFTRAGKVTDLRGSINWARYCVHGPDSGILNLSLTLTDADPSSQKLLTECIPHPAKDMKGFWDCWDQARGIKETASPLPTKIGLPALSLLLSGLLLQVDESLQLVGWVLWLGGTLLVASQAVRFWKSLQTSH